MGVLRAIGRVKFKSGTKYIYYILTDGKSVKVFSVDELMQYVKHSKMKVDNLNISNSGISVKKGIELPEMHIGSMGVLRAIGRVKFKPSTKYIYYILTDGKSVKAVSVDELIQYAERSKIKVDNLNISNSSISVKPGVELTEMRIESPARAQKRMSADEAFEMCKNRKIKLKPLYQEKDLAGYVGSESTYHIILIIPDSVKSISKNTFSMLEGCITVYGGKGLVSTAGMFIECGPSLASLDLSNFDTSNVADMHHMFARCHNLQSLDLSHFDTSNVTNMDSMFFLCTSLQSLDVSSFDTSKVTNMRNMFYSCISLQSLDLSHFDTSNVTDMEYMFHACESLISFDLSTFDTSNVIDMSEMFSGCERLQSLELSNFNTSSVTNMSYMFNGCSSLRSLDVSHFNTSKVTNMEGMFGYCRSLQLLDVSNFDTSQVTDMRYMFSGCGSLQSLDVSNFDTSKVLNMSNMFGWCGSLQSLDVSHFNTSNVTDMRSMFSCCSSLAYIDVSHFNTSNVTDMSEMFGWCSSLQSLDVSHFNTSNVTDMTCMFGGFVHSTNIKFGSSIKQDTKYIYGLH